MWAQNAPHSISIPNQPSGTYVVEYYLAGINIESALNNNPTCNLVRDTLIIPDQSNPRIQSFQVALCNEHLIIELFPSTGYGVAPFQYQLEDKHGSITPLQNTQFFTAADTGNYVATIVDACNNKSNFNVFIDTIDYSIINFSGTNCIGDTAIITLLYSPYIRYDVIYPNGFVTHSNVLTIEDIQPEDEGWISIYKYLNIGDCYDTLSQFYYLDVNACTLPVELVKFDGNCHQGEIIFEWETLSETHHSHFEMEASLNGRDFITIGKINQGNEQERLKHYQFNYNNIERFKYFRLKQVDKDYSFMYSKIIKVDCEKEQTNTSVNIYPNPANDVLNIQTNGKPINNYIIFNEMGQILLQESNIETEIHIVRLDMLPPATYFVLIDNATIAKKFIKSNMVIR